MNCEQAKLVLVEYLLEEASGKDREEIGRHLQDCGVCAEEFAQLKQTMALLVRGEASEEIPKRIAVVAEPVSRWGAFWPAGARLALAGGGLLCIAIALLALFRTTVSYEEGNFQIAFGVPAAATSAENSSNIAPAVAGSRALSRAEVRELIAEAVAASETRQQNNATLLVETAAQQTEQRRRRDLREMAASFRYFQAAQTMMWKEQVQSQYMMGALVRQVGSASPAQ
ncbi:MAG: hypothetical protein IH846_11740 [Acidobacteria bacterium]|nr:hypothetical protein [Acidobacteriota bacterium]